MKGLNNSIPLRAEYKAVEGFFFNCFFVFSRKGGSAIGRQAVDKGNGCLVISQSYLSMVSPEPRKSFGWHFYRNRI